MIKYISWKEPPFGDNHIKTITKSIQEGTTTINWKESLPGTTRYQSYHKPLTQTDHHALSKTPSQPTNTHFYLISGRVWLADQTIIDSPSRHEDVPGYG